MDSLPKYLIADNSNEPDSLFVIHTEYPRFCLNVANDAIFWMQDFQKEDEKELEQITPDLIEAALTFYDQEMESLD